MKELTTKRQPIPQWMLSVVADVAKPDADLETRERLSGDASAVRLSVDEESFVGICKRPLIELRTKPPTEDKECMLVGLRKAGKFKTNENVVCHVDCCVGAPPPPLGHRKTAMRRHSLLHCHGHTCHSLDILETNYTSPEVVRPKIH